MGKDLSFLFHKMDIKMILYIFSQLVEILISIHNKGYIHGDISIQNVILVKDEDKIVNEKEEEEEEVEENFKKEEEKEESHLYSTTYCQKSSSIYLIDWGLSGKIGNSSFQTETRAGNPIFGSLNSMNSGPMEETDDWESLFYLFFFLLKNELPWFGQVFDSSSLYWEKESFLNKFKNLCNDHKITTTIHQEEGEIEERKEELEENEEVKILESVWSRFPKLTIQQKEILKLVYSSLFIVKNPQILNYENLLHHLQLFDDQQQQQQQHTLSPSLPPPIDEEKEKKTNNNTHTGKNEISDDDEDIQFLEKANQLEKKQLDKLIDDGGVSLKKQRK